MVAAVPSSCQAPAYVSELAISGGCAAEYLATVYQVSSTTIQSNAIYAKAGSTCVDMTGTLAGKTLYLLMGAVEPGQFVAFDMVTD